MGIIIKISGAAISLAAMSIAVLGSDALAQDIQRPPSLIPGLENFTLQQPSPTPTPTPTPSATVAPPPVRATLPAPERARPAPLPKPVVAPKPIPSPAAAPPALAPVPVSTPVASATPAAPTLVPQPAPSELPPILWIVAGIALAAIGAMAFRLFSRRREQMEPLTDIEGAAEQFPAPAPESTPAPKPAMFTPPAAPLAVDTRPAIAITFTPRRAGTNVTSGAVDYEVKLHNAGQHTAKNVRVEIRLSSASAAQAAELQAVFSAPIERPVVAPFDLSPGGDVALNGMAMLPRAALNVIRTGGREVFVPVMTVHAVFDWGSGNTDRAVAAYVVGIDRGGEARLAPFRLDAGPRMHDVVAQREVPLQLID